MSRVILLIEIHDVFITYCESSWGQIEVIASRWATVIRSYTSTISVHLNYWPRIYMNSTKATVETLEYLYYCWRKVLYCHFCAMLRDTDHRAEHNGDINKRCNCKENMLTLYEAKFELSIVCVVVLFYFFSLAKPIDNNDDVSIYLFKLLL